MPLQSETERDVTHMSCSAAASFQVLHGAAPHEPQGNRRNTICHSINKKNQVQVCFCCWKIVAEFDRIFSHINACPPVCPDRRESWDSRDSGQTGQPGQSGQRTSSNKFVSSFFELLEMWEIWPIISVFLSSLCPTVHACF